MLAYFIVSDKLGVSSKSYATEVDALEAGVASFRKKPERVGKFTIEQLDTDPMSAYNLGYCQCDNRACECDIAEMQAVYLDAISV